MATKTSLVNIALRQAMCARVNDVDTDTSREARDARDFYDDTRKELLRSYLWSFAKKRDTLAAVVTVPDFGVDYAYALPSDWLRTITVHPSDSDFGVCRYKHETILVSGTPTKVIVSNISTALYLRYVWDVETVALFDPMFVNAFTWALSAKFALSIRESQAQSESYDKKFQRAVSTAKSTNSIEDWPDEFPAGSWVTSRDGWSGDSWGGDCWA